MGPRCEPVGGPFRHARAVAAQRGHHVRLVAHLDDLELPVVGILVGDRVLTLDVLVERAGLREELAFLDPRGLLAEDELLAETRAALDRALADGLAGVPAASLRPAPPLEPASRWCSTSTSSALSQSGKRNNSAR